MDIFSLLSMCDSEEKGKRWNIGTCTWIFIALVTIIPGAIFKFSSEVHDIAGFWHWLWHGETPVDADFGSKRGRTRLVDLNGAWKFAIGDDANRALPDFDDSSWSSVNVASGWEEQGYPDYDGYAWYRRSFNMDASALSQPLYAFLGRIDDVDAVFINGALIGGQGVFPPDYATAWDAERVYRVPADLVHAGTNVIAIRVYDGRENRGISGKALGLYTTNLPRPLIDLSGEWEFSTGNNPEWKDEAVSKKFESIRVPGYWEHAGYEHYDGHAWYRKTFGELPVAANETLILFLGKIDDTDEVFLNGRRIGGTSGAGGLEQPGRSHYDRNRRYEFSSDLLKETNTLAVHVYDGQQGGGIYRGPIGIMKKTDYFEYQKQAKALNKWRPGETIDWLLGRDKG
jgi:sialate O-acetylesterase